MDVKYDTPIEVSKEQYLTLKTAFEQIIAHREINGRFEIKLLDMRFKKQLQDFLDEK